MILDRLKRGERLRHYETVRLRKDGSELAVSLTVSPILGPSGEIVGASKIVRDISQQRQSLSRIEELQAELVHVARLSTMGQMASSIAHELNQPLTAVGNYAGALSRLLDAGNANPTRVRDIVERIRQQTTRAGEVIRRLRDHVVKRTTKRLLEDVNAVVKEKFGIGYGGIAYLEGIHAIKVKKDETSPSVAPSLKTAQDGTYPIARFLFFYTAGPAAGTARRFMDWVQGPEGQGVIEQVGYYPLPKS